MRFKVVGVGELLWDLLPYGAEVGGAPSNFAYHAHALGAQAQVISRVGNDRYGHEIIRRIKAMGLPAGGVQVDESAPTGTVTVSLIGDGIPEYTIHENVAWDRIAVTPPALADVREADAICFGSLAQRSTISRQSIQRLVGAAAADAWRVFDVNLRQGFYNREGIEHSLQMANALKLNEEELSVVAEMFQLPRNPRKQMESLANAFGLRVVVLTRGSGGSVILQAGRWSEQSAVAARVVDTVGAGDAFTSALVLGLLHRDDLDAVHAFAAEVAGWICGCAGGTPALPKKLRDHFRDSRPARQLAPQTVTLSKSDSFSLKLHPD